MSINERSRRERFFGCLSRHTVPSQSLLGGCVGRRAPSDENVSIYAPLCRYPRHSNQYPFYKFESLTDLDKVDATYFRRQPASILSTPSKIMVNDSTDIRQSFKHFDLSISGAIEQQKYKRPQL